MERSLPVLFDDLGVSEPSDESVTICWCSIPASCFSLINRVNSTYVWYPSLLPLSRINFICIPLGNKCLRFLPLIYCSVFCTSVASAIPNGSMLNPKLTQEKSNPNLSISELGTACSKKRFRFCISYSTMHNSLCVHDSLLVVFPKWKHCICVWYCIAIPRQCMAIVSNGEHCSGTRILGGNFCILVLRSEFVDELASYMWKRCRCCAKKKNLISVHWSEAPTIFCVYNRCKNWQNIGT